MEVTRPHYRHNGPVVVTGPIKGTVTTRDGVTYDVTEPVVAVRDLDHAHEVAHLIGVRYEDEGHPDHTPDNPFVHVCTEHCPED